MTKIKLLTKPEQFVPGMKADVYSEHGRFLHVVMVHSNAQDHINYEYDGKVFSHKLADCYFGLVSYPERRKLTWENVKDLQCPFDTYTDNNDVELCVFANDTGALIYDCDNEYCFYPWNNLTGEFIDPPYPEVPEVDAPWEFVNPHTHVVNKTELTVHVDTVVDKSFDPSVRRMWWVIVEKDPFVTEYAYTLEELKENFRSLKSYAPADAVPPESEWRKV